MNNTFTAKIVTTHRNGIELELKDETFVRFNNRQAAIDYLWPFCAIRSRRIGVGKRASTNVYKCSIIVDRDTPFERFLYSPNF
jgi:hypothetical protein